ncbi:MAG: efflux RND transporter permease subunit, partial [Gemmatimonadales bacterium]|nr:efflux RND transporter permease subunit [Gemmatimonadales bacterium]
QVNVAGPYDLVRLREVAEDLQDELEQIPSVLEVALSGGLEREVQVDVDLSKLKLYGLSFDHVIAAIRRENVTVPGGSIDVGQMKYLTRVPGEFTTPGPIADIVIESRGGRAIYVRDVATVTFGFKDRETIARFNGNPVVSLAVSKRGGENIIETADRVRAVIEGQRSTFPPGTEVTITGDQSVQIDEMVANLENNIISGVILVVGVLVFFLGLRTAWFVGLAIPMSMLLSFSVIRAIGVTINMVVLFSLILSLGMLVDNAIVIVENIYRFREHGHDRSTAAKLATAEVAMPVIASTATTLAAFSPLVFWTGIVGEFMAYLPITLITTLSSSLFVALVIVPTLCSLFLAVEDEPARGLTPTGRRILIGSAALVVLLGLATNPLTTILLALTLGFLAVLNHYVLHPTGHWFMNHGLPQILKRYRGVLEWALGHRIRMMLGAVAALILAVLAFGAFNSGIEFFPEDIPPETVYVQIEAPIGTRLEQIDTIAQRIENRLGRLEGRDDFESVVTTVGSQTTSGMDAGTQGSHLASVAVNFIDFQDRSVDALNTIETMRRTVATEIAGADISVERPQEGPPTGLPVNVEIVGQDPDTLRRLGNALVSLLEQSPVFAKLDGLESDMAEGQPELVIEVDRERAALYGLSTQAIGMTIRSAINGTEASTYRDGEDEYDITVRLAQAYREDLSALADLTVASPVGVQVPLSSVAHWDVGEGFAGINRNDLDRVVTVSAEVRSGFNANTTLTEVQQTAETFAAGLPPGYQLRYTGQQEEQAESQAFLMGAFVTAIMLMGFILVSQFNSVFKPVIILSAVILSTIGVLIGLLVFRMPFGIIMSGVGVISLAGVVVNNAIVLIDYINILRVRDGLSRLESLIRGGLTRFRPVVLTAITTVLGLVPLAIGLNFDFEGHYTRLEPELYWGGIQAAWWGPMAIAVIAGLTFATFLTLILVPVMFSLIDDAEDWLSRA